MICWHTLAFDLLLYQATNDEYSQSSVPGYVFVWQLITVSIGISIHTALLLPMCVFIQNDRTPLMTASFEGHVHIVRILIKAQAQVNTQDEVCCYKITHHKKHALVKAVGLYLLSICVHLGPRSC